MGEGVLLFELRGPDGHVWKFWSNGISEGFPDGCILTNHVYPLLAMAVSLQIKAIQNGLIPENEATNFGV